MRRSLVYSLVGILGIAVIAFGATLLSGNRPLLGLDLRGGASVVLQPQAKVDKGVLNQAISIIRKRVDALGVAEPNISRQGTNVVIELPGIKNPQNALQVVGQTAELRFRPLLCAVPAAAPSAGSAAAPAYSANYCSLAQSGAGASLPTTPVAQDLPDATVLLPMADGSGARYLLGPVPTYSGTKLSGRIISTASATPPDIANGQPSWYVSIRFTGAGGPAFDHLAQANYQKQVAIELDGQIESAPTIQQQSYNGRAIINGANFTQKSAQNLALQLRYGSLPVQFKSLSIQTVSATLGKDSLRAGLVAGAVGLILVLTYMIFYYRALGVVVVAGLGLSGILLYSIISELSQSSGLALSLAGATGIIVSVGVTADSYIVYFERLKDEIRSGKSVRSSVDRGFARAYRTIFAADLVSIMAALILYLFTVSSVRGFAFFLGLSTLLDLITAYFFTRPMVSLLGRNRLFTEARFFGVARGLAARPSTALTPRGSPTPAGTPAGGGGT